MTTFDNRKKTHEKKMVFDAEREFRIQARRNKLLGQWAGELLGKTDDDLGAYILEVIKSDMQEAGDDDVFRKVKQDLVAAGTDFAEVELRQKMDNLLVEARDQILAENEV